MANWWIDESYYPGPSVQGLSLPGYHTSPRNHQYGMATDITRTGHSSHVHIRWKQNFPLVPTSSPPFIFHYTEGKP